MTARRYVAAAGLGVLAVLTLAGCVVGRAEEVRPPIEPIPATSPAPAGAATPEAFIAVAPPAAPATLPELSEEPAPSPAPPADAVPTAEDQVVALANVARQEAGLPLLGRSAGLDAVARSWSTRLATDGRDLAHNPDYSAQIPAGWTAAAENVGWIQDGGRMSPEEVAASVHAGWMASPGHAANLLNPAYTHIGVGIAHSPAHGYYLTQNFAAY